MNQDALQRIEVDLLLEAIFQVYGYDFREYSKASMDRRVRQFIAAEGYRTIGELIPGVLHDKSLFFELAKYFSVSVTAMFRDPFVYRVIREKVLPRLRSHPFFKFWHAGCATGEEVYSMAILLFEEGLLDRSTLYATDFNQGALDKARKGIYPLARISEYTRNYQHSGSKSSFSEYYHAMYGAATLRDDLKARITFAGHNLVTDSVFGDTHMVFSRNVLIYFSKKLKDRVLNLFTDSLVHGGFLCLGTAESIEFSDVAAQYEVIDSDARIYRKVT
ncbi:MAG: protein-glutamate O-methyltransferase CheR [Thermodesulfobacteriota bacterium]